MEIYKELRYDFDTGRPDKYRSMRNIAGSDSINYRKKHGVL